MNGFKDVTSELKPRTKKQRELIGAAVLSLGNGILLVLTFGQFVSNENVSLKNVTVSLLIYLSGILLWIVCYWVADVIMRGRKKPHRKKTIENR